MHQESQWDPVTFTTILQASAYMDELNGPEACFQLPEGFGDKLDESLSSAQNRQNGSMVSAGVQEQLGVAAPNDTVSTFTHTTADVERATWKEKRKRRREEQQSVLCRII